MQSAVGYKPTFHCIGITTNGPIRHLTERNPDERNTKYPTRSNEHAVIMKQETQKIISQIQRFFSNQPVERAYLFGSFSRGDETDKSDVDILVDIDKSAHIGLFKYVAMKLDLQEILHREVDLVESDSLLPFAQETANKDKILIYERTKS